jgi:hypothetical protein
METPTCVKSMEYDDQSKKDVERDEVGNKRLSSS